MGVMHIVLPTLFESDQLPINREKIQTPEAAHYNAHLRRLVKKIPAMDMNAEMFC